MFVHALPPKVERSSLEDELDSVTKITGLDDAPNVTQITEYGDKAHGRLSKMVRLCVSISLKPNPEICS